MMIERKILEALDACRPESDDLQAADHPELADAAALVREDASVREVLARVQHFDMQIRQTMDEVELPVGLAARVKARLAEAAMSPAIGLPTTAAVDQSVESAAAEAAEPVTLPVPTEPTRRNWMWTAVSALAASVAVAVGVWQFGPEGEVQLSREEFRTLSREFHTQAQDPAGWQTDLSQAPANLPFPSGALLARVKRFKTFANDRHAVAYDVTYGNKRATLIVYRGTVPKLDLVPPRTPFDTQNLCVGLWQRNGLLFALVVEGSPASYRQFLQSNQGTLG